ncbi:hypothetical protein LTR56_013624 [Elasticomyces elasticus]|nr:hypothetical protein LTR22_018436 [Elasticomyces elasticus]KAK3637451.1 hypothetical protein LTR56_013624 [Elasticomyces elasticus]KAK4917890.1 hypothetical protein LTR49_014294 [Elasticomyces elasticus]KAK5757049.1 hypothetical protein LTS12_012863 [Elasticomyces elasticus]
MTLLRLPNELLISIFETSPDIFTALRFASVDRRLRGIWTDDITGHQIVRAILSSQIPAYDEAVDLATTEVEAESQISLSISPRPWLPRLLHNAEMARSVCWLFTEFIDKLPPNNYRRRLIITALPISYYFIRQLVTAHRQKANANISKLLSELEVSSSNTLQMHWELYMFMCEYMNEGERARHDMPKDREDRVAGDDLYGPVNKEEWDSTFSVLESALENKSDEY